MKNIIKTIAYAFILAVLILPTGTLHAQEYYEGDGSDLDLSGYDYNPSTYQGGYSYTDNIYDNSNYQSGYTYTDNIYDNSNYESGYSYTDNIYDNSNYQSDYSYLDDNCADSCGTSYVDQSYSGDSCSTCGSTYNSTPSYSNGSTYSYVPTQTYVQPVYNQPTQPTYNQPMSVACYATPSSVNIGDSVTFVANVSGGNGNYSYQWTVQQSSDVYGSNTNETGRSITRTFNTEGSKNASVRVTSSNGQSQNAYCSAYINPRNVVNPPTYVGPTYNGPTYNGPTYNPPTYVPPTYPTYYPPTYVQPYQPVYQQPVYPIYNPVQPVNTFTPVGQNYSGVYLSALPQTGLSANMKNILFVVGLGLWSAFLAYLYLAYRKRQVALATFGAGNTSVESDVVATVEAGNSDAVNALATNREAMSTYARSKNMLLSHDAADYLASMNAEDAHSLMNKVASTNDGSEWMTVNKAKLA